jgi:RNA polymerase sigma-70 factor (sigma-E family)
VQVPEGFEEFVSSRGPALVRAAYLLTGDHQLAEDLVQTALARAVLRWRSIQGNPEAYVRRVLFTQRVSQTRRRRVGERLVADPELGTPAGSTPPTDDAAERRLMLRRALSRLTPRQRAVLVLRFYEDRTEAETAALLGIGLGTVKSQTRRALRRLRELSPEVAEFAPADDQGGAR